MRMSNLFSQTLREAPGDAEVASHQRLIRAGVIRQLAAGIFTMMPLGKRIADKVGKILREEIDAIGGQELTMPVVQPGEIWKESGRWFKIDAEMARFQDRGEREMALGMTHEEVVTDLVRREVQSYKQLPRLVYQIQTKFRDDPRPRAGLIRVREFVMKDSYSLDVDEAGLDAQYRAHYQAYFDIFARSGLPVIAVKSDVGMMGGSLAHEYMYLTPIGEDTLLLCDACGYAANRQNATFVKPKAEAEDAADIERVHTPGTATIEELAAFLKVPAARTAKAVFMVATVVEDEGEVETFVLATVRGDLEVNETKLANALKAKALRSAHDTEIRAAGAVPGYGSAIGVSSDVVVVADDSVRHSANLVAGANEADYHLKNVNLGRDFKAQIVADIAAARDGDACPQCEKPLRTSRGVEVGNIFKLGTQYSATMGATFLDEAGKRKPVVMGSYGIGVGRLIACVAEAHHDEHGLIWPISLAPFQVHLVSLHVESEDIKRQALALYAALRGAGIEVLIDDRDERPGVKFKDADLIGIPLRVTLSERSLKEGGVEFKRRTEADRKIVPLDGIQGVLEGEIAALQRALDERVVEVAFDG